MEVLLGKAKMRFSFFENKDKDLERTIKLLQVKNPQISKKKPENIPLFPYKIFVCTNCARTAKYVSTWRCRNSVRRGPLYWSHLWSNWWDEMLQVRSFIYIARLSMFTLRGWPQNVNNTKFWSTTWYWEKSWRYSSTWISSFEQRILRLTELLTFFHYMQVMI